MKTDELFYELFRFSPESLLELLQLEVHGRYCFATPLVVLKSLTLADQAELPKAVEEWKAGIEEMGLSEDRKKALNDLLEYAILQRFKTLTLKEIREMIQLTPLEETVAGKELMEKGKEIGKIQLLQLLLKQPRSPENALEDLTLKRLKPCLPAWKRNWRKKRIGADGLTVCP